MKTEVKEIDIKESNIIKRRELFNKRWDILEPSNDRNKTKNRCLTVISKMIEESKRNQHSDFGLMVFNSDDYIKDYCNEMSLILGTERNKVGFLGFEHDAVYKYVYSLDLNKEEDYKIFMWFLEVTINHDFKGFIDKDKLAINLLEALKISDAGIKILKENENYTLYPQRLEFLDDPLIIDNLMWLDEYPQAKDSFAKAIKEVEKKGNYRNIVDNLRFSLESLFQKLFQNKKSLENQKNNIGTYMKDNNVSPIISNMYIKLMDLYMKYNDDNAKHGDNIESIEIDYLIYLTGSFIRFILEIEKSKKELKLKK